MNIPTPVWPWVLWVWMGRLMWRTNRTERWCVEHEPYRYCLEALSPLFFKDSRNYTHHTTWSLLLKRDTIESKNVRAPGFSHWSLTKALISIYQFSPLLFSECLSILSCVLWPLHLLSTSQMEFESNNCCFLCSWDYAGYQQKLLDKASVTYMQVEWMKALHKFSWYLGMLSGSPFCTQESPVCCMYNTSYKKWWMSLKHGNLSAFTSVYACGLTWATEAEKLFPGDKI